MIAGIGAGEKGDDRIEATLCKGQEVVPVFFAADVHAFTAEHAAEGIIGEIGKVDFRLDETYDPEMNQRLCLAIRMSWQLPFTGQPLGSQG